MTMMSAEVSDFENIQVENCQLWIPSNICTDLNIFQHIFSLNTWNTIFTADQRERILKMLPGDVVSSAGAAASTIAELLSGALTRFNSNPLDVFFRELNMGGYDPEVAEIKVKMKREWRRDLLRRKRHYHTKLMQEVIISSQTSLQKFRDKPISKQDQLQILNSPNPGGKVVKVIQSKEGTTTKAPKKKSNASKPSPLRQKVAKRLHNEIQAMNQAFPPSVSTTDGPPAPKKPKPKSKKAIPKTTGATDGISASHVVKSPPTPSSDLAQPQLLKNPTRVKVNDLPQATIQMAKFPSVIPPSLLGVINVTQSPAGLSNPPKPFVSLNHYDIKVPPSSKEFVSPSLSPTTLISPQVMQKHVLKSSPILASQLQAPIGGSGMKPATVFVQLQKIKTEPPTPCPPALKTVKTEEETSSDEDEFEAIEPTIGFSTLLPGNKHTPAGANQRAPLNSKASGGYAARRLQPGGNKVPPGVKKSGSGGGGGGGMKRVVVTQVTPNITVSSSSSTTLQPPSAVNVKVTNSKAIITTTAAPPLALVNKVNLKVNSVKMSPLVPFITTSQAVSGVSSLPTPTLPPSNSSTKLLPITLSNLTQQQQSLNAANTLSSRSGLFHVTSVGSTSQYHHVSSTSGGVVVNGGMSSSLASTPRSTTTVRFTTTTAASVSAPTNSVSLGQFGGPLACSSPTVAGLSRISATPSPLPLTLSDLSLSLNLGLDMRGDKLEGDKIDDLPVLDGNAFDSIPNLSDDLDVFDLDLVDGLCDFEVMLSEEKQYSSFFALIREVLCSTQNHRMTFSCLEKTVQKWSLGPSAELNPWFHRITGWNEALITALNFLAGNYQEIHPEDFVPYLEYKYKTKYYQWIGAGRDSDGNLLMLCNMWLENLAKLPPMKKQEGENEEQEEEEDENEDSDDHAEEVKKKYLRPKTPPPPRFVTEWTVRPSTADEKEEFQLQEKVRFDNPHKAFTYRMHKYESVVGPVKGVYSNQTGVTNKARGHSLLVDERPPYVTILALVRDSVARLPNGEGTRSEICEMLRDSTFLAPEASNVTLNSVVSGALDRLHYERDPCVRYDSHKKNWIYLHRDRSQDQFERLHHNRSYTKSTKSRNSGGRKSRKKTLSQTSGASIAESTSSNPTPSSSSSVSSTPGTTPKITAPPNLITAIGPPEAEISTAAGPTITTTSARSAPSPLPTVTSSAKSGTVNNVFVSATTGSAPTIQFAIPVSSGQMNKSEQVRPTTQFNQMLPSYAEATSSAFTLLHSAGGTGSVGSGLNTQPPPKALSIKLETPTLPVTLSSPATTTSTTPSLQQQSFILNNLFRLPNLKLPDNVRFMRIQQTPAGQVQMNPLRLPQQRIVLRPAYPGHVPGQGVIFGQTPTGQTVIISAIGSPQVLTTQSFQTNSTQQAVEAAKLPPTFTTPTLVNMGSPVTFSSSGTSGNMIPGNTPAMSRVVQTSSVMGSGGQSTTPPPSVVRFTAAGSAVAASTRSIAATSTTSVTAGAPGAERSAIASPVVIRSNQMEYLIPGHQVSLGKGGVHGIKMVPMSPAGNQIFARLVAPTTSAAVVTQTQSTPNNTSTKALK